MDKQKYRPAFYRLNQEGFIRWAKSQDNIVNRDIWRKTGRARRKMVKIGCETSGIKTFLKALKSEKKLNQMALYIYNLYERTVVVAVDVKEKYRPGQLRSWRTLSGEKSGLNWPCQDCCLTALIVFSSPLCWAWPELEMDYVLLLKWSGDTNKNTTGRITEIEGGGSQEIGRQEK